MGRRILLALGFFVFGFGFSTSLSALEPDLPTREWRAGPIRYILNLKEDSQFKKLRTPEERRAFIESFWAALDPTPATPANERRAVFWTRVERATSLFQDSVLPGWKTDRGKIYILLGPPDEMHLREGGQEWIYRALPSPHVPAEIRLGFRRDQTGEHHLLPGPLQYHRGLVARDGIPLGDSFLGLSTQIAGAQLPKGRIRMPEFPSGDVKAEFFFGPLQHVPRTDFYKAADGTTFVTLTVSVPLEQFRDPDGKVGRPQLSLSAAVEGAEDHRVVERFTELMRLDAAGARGPCGSLRFQAGFNLPPGVYEASFTLFDLWSRRGSVLHQTITSPDFRRGLALSTVAMSRLATDPPKADPFRLGKILPIPDPEAAFLSGETMMLSYEVYNARHRQDTADLDVEYRFFLDTGHSLEQVGKPVLISRVTREALAYSLPLSGWPPGRYVVRIRVTDNHADAQAIREERFRVLESNPEEPSTEPSPPPGLSPG